MNKIQAQIDELESQCNPSRVALEDAYDRLFLYSELIKKISNELAFFTVKD